MSLISTWVLVGYYWASYGGGAPLLIDNIASLAECERVKVLVAEAMPNTWRARCIEIRRAR